jgi:hypothetical protein
MQLQPLWLCTFCQTTNFFFVEKDSKFAFAKATQLPSIIEAEKLCLQEDKKQPRAHRMSKSAQHVQYYQVRHESVT